MWIKVVIIEMIKHQACSYFKGLNQWKCNKNLIKNASYGWDGENWEVVPVCCRLYTSKSGFCSYSACACPVCMSAGSVAEGQSEWKQINEVEHPTSLLLQRPRTYTRRRHQRACQHTSAHIAEIDYSFCSDMNCSSPDSLSLLRLSLNRTVITSVADSHW